VEQWSIDTSHFPPWSASARWDMRRGPGYSPTARLDYSHSLKAGGFACPFGAALKACRFQRGDRMLPKEVPGQSPGIHQLPRWWTTAAGGGFLG